MVTPAHAFYIYVNGKLDTWNGGVPCPPPPYPSGISCTDVRPAILGGTGKQIVDGSGGHASLKGLFKVLPAEYVSPQVILQK